jgi:hypothetical protein
LVHSSVVRPGKTDTTCHGRIFIGDDSRAPLGPTPFVDPSVEYAARGSELIFILSPALGPLGVHVLRRFQEAWRLLDAVGLGRVQHAVFKLKPHPIKNGTQSALGISDKGFVPNVHNIRVGEPGFNGFSEFKHACQHLSRCFNIQKMTVDPVGGKVLGKARKHDITRISDRSDDHCSGPQLQDHRQINDVHWLFVHEARRLRGFRHHVLCGPVEQVSELFGFRTCPFWDKTGQAFNGLPLQQMLSDRRDQWCFTAGRNGRVSGQHAFQQRCSRPRKPHQKVGRGGNAAAWWIWICGWALQRCFAPFGPGLHLPRPQGAIKSPPFREFAFDLSGNGPRLERRTEVLGLIGKSRPFMPGGGFCGGKSKVVGAGAVLACLFDLVQLSEHRAATHHGELVPAGCGPFKISERFFKASEDSPGLASNPMKRDLVGATGRERPGRGPFGLGLTSQLQEQARGFGQRRPIFCPLVKCLQDFESRRCLTGPQMDFGHSHHCGSESGALRHSRLESRKRRLVLAGGGQLLPFFHQCSGIFPRCGLAGVWS